ncbi:hypothetical protein, conserved [Eimeria necatrix]|uniref:Uncharacterized protein n=1 Tax=Eimeria necatrix TaxID=51315 RepID=U6MXJ4_9EIME|nr:hypothetical protein, conserved [Eimeria necatrix]CDJ67743.1 hypothetical protein, conserved [Eimeria necatrix]
MAPSGASEEATPVADTSAGAPAMPNASNNSESPQLMQSVVSAHPSHEPGSTSRTSKYDRETCFIRQMLGAIGRCCGLGKGGLCRRWLTYLERLDVSWTCAEDRTAALDKQTLSTMKHTYWLSRINGGLLGSSGITPASLFVSETKNAFGDVRGWERIKALPSLFLFVPPTDSWLRVFSFIGAIN